MFHYRKLYADVVTQAGSVCVGYASWLRLLGCELCSAGFEWYPQGGERRVLRALGPARVQRGAGEVSLQFRTSSGDFCLVLNGAGVTPQTEPHQLTDHLSWKVLTTNAQACARGPAGLEPVRGTGYADIVEMTRPPRALGLLSVEWGRGHAGEESFVFTQACFRGGRAFRSAVRDGASSSELRLEHSSQADLNVLIADARITLHNERVLHAGSALDCARFPARVERTLARLCSGRMRETRWLSRAIFPSGASALALHEKVLLG